MAYELSREKAEHSVMCRVVTGAPTCGHIHAGFCDMLQFMHAYKCELYYLVSPTLMLFK